MFRSFNRHGSIREKHKLISADFIEKAMVQFEQAVKIASQGTPL